MTQTTLTLEHLVKLLAGSIFHTSIRYMDFVEIFNNSLDLCTVDFIFLILVGVELLLCIVVKSVFWSQVEYKSSVLFMTRNSHQILKMRNSTAGTSIFCRVSQRRWFIESLRDFLVYSNLHGIPVTDAIPLETDNDKH